MEIYTATLIIQKHLNWQNDKRNLPKVNEEKLKKAVNLLTEYLSRDMARKQEKYTIVVDPDFEIPYM